MSKVVKRAQKTSPSKQVKVTKTAKTAKVPKDKGVKKPRVKKSRTAPKRPRSAFIMFMSDHRAEIIKENPGIAFIDIPKVGSEKWKNLKPVTKAKYEKAFEADKERYAMEMASYVPDPNESKKKRKVKDPNAPKRAITSYIYFVNANRDKVKAAHPEYNPKQVVSQLGAQWNAMNEKDRKPFEAMALKDKARYEAEIAKFNAGKQ